MSNLSRPLKESTDDDFISILDRYAAYISQAGKRVFRSSPENARQIFSALAQDQRELIVNRLRNDLSLFDEMVLAGEKLNDNRNLLWRYFSKSGLRPTSDVFDKIDDTDVIEVYGLTNTHLCQNFNFFDWISLPLERIFCEPWYLVTKRDKAIEQQLHQVVSQVYSGHLKQTFAPNVNWHWIEEQDSELLYKFQFHLKWISPVYAGTALAGFIAVSECKDLTPGR